MINVLMCLLAFMMAPANNSKYFLEKRSYEVRTMTESRDINYKETFEEINNSDCGFYYAEFYRLLPEGNVSPEFLENFSQLRLDISAFCSKYNGSDIPISEDALRCLDEMLTFIESNGQSAVIRFSYDSFYDGMDVKEPSIDMILTHQEQLGPILAKHKNAITCVETGLLGLWGELHGTDMCKKENLVAVVDKWLEVLPKSICVSVRTPLHYCWWKGIKRENISWDFSYYDEDSYRVGIYNDGYFGSASDLGTYSDRKEEVKWLFYQARHALFGGELMTINSLEEGQTYSSLIENEAFMTHTSYLNGLYSQVAIENLKTEIYNGNNKYYWGQTGYVFLRNHLGYRFVLKDVIMTEEVSLDDKILIRAVIDNVGFANLVKPKKLYIIFEGERYKYYIPVTEHKIIDDEYIINGDPVKWDSDTRVYVRVSMNLPNGIIPGNYKVYFKIAYSKTDVDNGNSDYPVRFANDDENIWNEDLGANYIGRMRIIKSRTEFDEK